MAACWFAIIKAGGIVVATMPLLRARELADDRRQARISHALCDARLADELEAARPACPTLTSTSAAFDVDRGDGARSAARATSPRRSPTCGPRPTTSR